MLADSGVQILDSMVVRIADDQELTHSWTWTLARLRGVILRIARSRCSMSALPCAQLFASEGELPFLRGTRDSESGDFLRCY